MQSVLIVDGFSLAFRAFYSFPTSLRLSPSEPVNTVFGFLSMLFSAIDELKPTHVIVCFDRKEPTFRHVQYDLYKAHRPEPPEDFIVQIEPLKKAIQDCGFVIYEKAGYEADDLMGTWAHYLDGLGVSTLLMTGDQDSYQLVTDHISVVINKKGVSQLLKVTPDYIQEHYGLTPKQLIDLKALKGDTSDNVPGVSGVGEKTALSLMHQFGNLDTLYQKLHEVKLDRVRGLLESSKEMAYLSRDLVRICETVPIELDLGLVVFQPDWQKIVSIFESFRFESLVKKYKKRLGSQVDTLSSSDGVVPLISEAPPQGDYILIDNETDLKALIPTLASGFAVDLETTSLQAVDAEIVGVALCNLAGKAYYIACNDFISQSVDTSAGILFALNQPPSRFELNPFLVLLKPLLENPSVPKIAHNAKYEMLVFGNYGIFFKGLVFDTMLAAFVLFPGEKVGLKELALLHLGVKMMTYEDVAGTGKNQISFKHVDLDQATQYAACDADMTWQLYQLFAPKITEKGFDSLFYGLELPVQSVLVDVEREGVTLDVRFLQELSERFSKELESVRQDIFRVAGFTFNVSSPKQLSEVLYDKLNLPVLKTIKTGRSTDSSVLEKLAKDHDIARLLMRYRMLEKLLTTYVTALPELVVKRTGKIHTSFNQTIAITGRLSSTNPNLQNIPIRSEEGQEIRKAFIPSSPDRFILSVDYSQIELRVMAYLAQDEGLIASFKAGEDIHARTAAIVNGVALDAVTKEQRYAAKAINFGILYGQSSFGLSEQMDIDRSEAKRIIDDYFAKLPKVKLFIESTIAFAKANGFVKTEFGRVRFIPDIHEKVFHRRQFAERVAVNTRVQGTAADVMKLAMIRVKERMDAEQFKSKMIIQVHDELVFDVLQDELDRLVSLVTETMESVVDWPVPLKVDVSVGKNWAEA